MLKDPLSPFNPGVPLQAQLTAGKLNGIMAEIAACRMQQGAGGMLFTRDSGGTTVSRRRTRNGTATALKLQAVDASASGTAKVTVTFGQYNSVTPTIGGTALDAATPPQLTVTVSGVIYAEITMTDSTTPSSISTVTIQNAASLPSATDTLGYQTIATVTILGGAVTALNNALAGSQSLLKCGDTTYTFGSV
jgi:hypothetical protein